VAGKELATAWLREAKDVFEVRTRSRDRARDGGIERSAQRRGAGRQLRLNRSRRRGRGCPRAVSNRPRDEAAARAAAIRASNGGARRRPLPSRRGGRRSGRDLSVRHPRWAAASDRLSWSQISCLVVAHEPKGGTSAAFTAQAARSRTRLCFLTPRRQALPPLSRALGHFLTRGFRRLLLYATL
jgi:hypothetical protein